jgi:hypothetical protein
MKTNPTTIHEPMLPIESETLMGGGVVKLNPAPMATSPAIQTPIDILMGLMSRPDVDLERMERFLSMHERWEANEARKAYVQAMAEFKKNPPTITKDKRVEFGNTKYKHAELDQVSEKVGEALSKVGISHSWTVNQSSGVIRVTCTLTHVQGHSESVTMEGAPDASGQKNAIQQIASAVTYLQRYTLMMASGVAAGSDDDGRQSAGEAFGMTEDVFQGHLRNIVSAPTLSVLQSAFTAAWNAAKKDQATQKAIIDAKDKRKAELAGGAK